MNIKKILPKFVVDQLKLFKEMKSLYRRTRPIYQRLCSICRYRGYFKDTGTPPRIDAKCPQCGSLERHRLFWLWAEKNIKTVDEPIIHFAPEKVLENKLRGMFSKYQSADLYSPADLKLNIEKIELDSATVSTVICNHVLEHVDDVMALNEMNRVLVDNGLLISSVPLIEGWELTYENAKVNSQSDKEVHFGQNDHVRFYGSDFRKRLLDAGFEKVEEFTAEGEAVIEYGLIRGEKLFIYKKACST